MVSLDPLPPRPPHWLRPPPSGPRQLTAGQIARRSLLLGVVVLVGAAGMVAQSLGMAGFLLLWASVIASGRLLLSWFAAIIVTVVTPVLALPFVAFVMLFFFRWTD